MTTNEKSQENLKRTLIIGSEKLSQDQKELGIVHAEVCTESAYNAAIAIKHLNNGGPDLVTLIDQLNLKVKKINRDDVDEISAMLIIQAQTLDSIFNNMVMKLGHSELIPQAQVYAEIAMKAQNQCRKTLQALAELKNPKRTTFVKQQNLALNQQINNGKPQANSKNFKKLANELLIEVKKDETLDSRRTLTPIPINSKLEAMEVGGGKITRGKSHKSDECV